MIGETQLINAFLGEDIPADEDVDKWLAERKDHIDPQGFHEFWIRMVYNHGFVIATVMLASFQITFDLMMKELHLTQQNIEI